MQAPLVYNLGTRWSASSLGHFNPLRKNPASIAKLVGWAPDRCGRFRGEERFLSPTEIRTTDLPGIGNAGTLCTARRSP
jgi:hypothetical protein